MHRSKVTTLEVTASRRSARLTTPTWKVPSDISVVKAMVDDAAVVIEEAHVDIL
jgi:hypothetical protein